ncbi:biopolymer transporter ExbD [Acetobacteraceae bacterium]|nr:biopolymer transporter ExbD [Acetobacteraceae bacterium]
MSLPIKGKVKIGSHQENDEGIVDINTTPLIDVMLVLLIMLIITVPLQTQSVAIDLPQGDPPPNEEFKTVTIGINYENALSWDGTPVASLSELDSKIRDFVADHDPKKQVNVDPNRLASYKTVASVLADCQRLGIKRLGISGLDKSVEKQ